MNPAQGLNTHWLQSHHTHTLPTSVEKFDTFEAMTHYETTSFNAKPMELKEEPDNPVP